MKPLLKTIAGLGAGTLIAGAGIGVYFAMRNSEKQERIEYVLKDETKLKITNTDGIAADTLKMFKQMVESQQFSGSEESMLNGIVIGPGGKGNNGEYINGGITINSKLIQDSHHFENHFDLAYYLYQIYSHEYLHFVADAYLTDASNVNSSFNANFLSEFKSLLHYDKATTKYSSQEIKPGFKSIGSTYDAKDIYDFANGSQGILKDDSFTEKYILQPHLTKKIKWVLEQGGSTLVMAPLNPAFQVNNKHVITRETLKYIYGIDELFARKYMLINTSYHPTLNNNMDTLGGFRPDGFINYNDKTGKRITGSSPYLEDVFNFRRSLNSKDGTYLQDNPFTAMVGLEKLYARIIGNTPNTIKNVKKFVSAIAISGNALVQTTNGKVVPPKSLYKFIGYTENKILKTYPITIKRKVQTMGDGTFIIRDTFFTDHKVPTGVDGKTLSLYGSDKDGKLVKLQPLASLTKFK